MFMKKRNKKIIIYSLAFFLTFQAYSIFAANNLEVDYPGFTPTSEENILPEYVKYIYNFIIIGAGATALWYLIEAGIGFLTATGDPEKMGNAKKKILAVLWGTIILLGSYLILTTINPRLTIFDLPGLTEQPKEPLPQPGAPAISGDILDRIKKMAEEIERIPPEVKNDADEIQELTDKCDCERTKPICLCSGGDANASCEAKKCYAGPDTTRKYEISANFPSFCESTQESGAHPCPDIQEIESLQKNIVDLRDVLLYYKNRALSEAKDLRDNIDFVLNKQIIYYQAKLSKTPDLTKTEIEFIQAKLAAAQKEKSVKEQLIPKLEQLADSLEKFREPTTELGQLPNECLVNVEKECNPSCKTGSQYGCHDKICGCQPDKCSGGNPCPTGEIQNRVGEIGSLPGEIDSICEQIIAIVKSL